MPDRYVTEHPNCWAVKAPSGPGHRERHPLQQSVREHARAVADTGRGLAWRAISHIAQQLGCPLTVKFAWREKQGAAFPGVIGQFSIAGQ